MTKNMIARRKKTALTKIRRLGAAGIGTSMLVTSSAALAHGSAPVIMPISAGHGAISGNHLVTGTTPWQTQIEQKGGSPTPAAAPFAAMPLHNGGIYSTTAHNFTPGSTAQTALHSRLASSGFSGLWITPQQSFLTHIFSTATTLAGTTLDLQSPVKNIILGSNVFQGTDTLTIRVGAKDQTFSAGQKVTAAEYLALNEVSATGTQTLKINGAGVATGGSFDFSNTGNLKLSNLIIPAHVSALDNVSTSSLSLSGDLLNYGSLYTIRWPVRVAMR
jgi:hypothetical protein